MRENPCKHNDVRLSGEPSVSHGEIQLTTGARSREKHDCIWPWVVIGLAPEMIRGRKCLGTGQTGQTGVTGNVLLARSPKTLTHDQDVRPGMVIPAALWSQGWDGNNKDPWGNKPPRSQGTPGGAMANGRQCRAERIRNAKNIPLVISDAF
jgi:hypothetical protein